MKANKFTAFGMAVIAFSMLSSAAFANPAKTSADFTDLTDVDASLKTKIDSMISAGILSGVSDTTFGITQNMTRAQFAKVAALVFGVAVDSNVQTSSFSDVRADDPANGWAVPYIEAAKKAGLIDGVTNTTFVPDESVTIGQLDTVLLKGLGKTIRATSTPWYADAVKQGTDLNIHATGKGGDESANRADLVYSSYTAWNLSHKEDQIALDRVSVVSAQASSDHLSVQVALDKQVDISKATLTLSNGTSTVNTTTDWSADRKSATLTVKDGALDVGSYQVTLGGIDNSTIQAATSSFTISDISVNISSGTIKTSSSYILPNVLDSGISDAVPDYMKADVLDPRRSKLAKEVEIKVTNSSGDDVAAPGLVQTISSSDPTVVKVGVSTDNRGYMLGNKPGTATVTVTVRIGSGETKVLQTTVTVKSDAIAAQKAEARNTTDTKIMTVFNGVYSSSFNATWAMDLTLTDNYGNTYKKEEILDYNFAFGMIWFADKIIGDPNKGPVGEVQILSDGTVLVTGNVSSFDLTCALPNGDKEVTYLNMRRS